MSEFLKNNLDVKDKSILTNQNVTELQKFDFLNYKYLVNKYSLKYLLDLIEIYYL